VILFSNRFKAKYAKELYKLNKNAKVISVDGTDVTVEEAEELVKQLQEKIDYLKK
jgi:hypothetical protein